MSKLALNLLIEFVNCNSGPNVFIATAVVCFLFPEKISDATLQTNKTMCEKSIKLPCSPGHWSTKQTSCSLQTWVMYVTTVPWIMDDWLMCYSRITMAKTPVWKGKIQRDTEERLDYQLGTAGNCPWALKAPVLLCITCFVLIYVKICIGIYCISLKLNTFEIVSREGHSRIFIPTYIHPHSVDSSSFVSWIKLSATHAELCGQDISGECWHVFTHALPCRLVQMNASSFHCHWTASRELSKSFMVNLWSSILEHSWHSRYPLNTKIL